MGVFPRYIFSNFNSRLCVRGDTSGELAAITWDKFQFTPLQEWLQALTLFSMQPPAILP